MKTLNWYVTRGFLVAFFMAIGILTFAMTGANLIKALTYLSQGVSFLTFCKFALYILPISLSAESRPKTSITATITAHGTVKVSTIGRM